ncbi:MAG: alanine racemase, partial [Planctomycetota bacterium]|nr:alanine racemase [Planctomycetota bacterium]
VPPPPLAKLPDVTDRRYRVWADVDLDALTHNLDVVRRRAGAGVRVMLVVKADAYGHGAVVVAQHAVRCGVGALGVGTAAEAFELRRAGLTVPVLVLGTIVDGEASAVMRHDIQIGLHSAREITALQETAERKGLTARVHLNVDTGMGRLGVLPDRAHDLLGRIHSAQNLDLAGVMSHISSPRGALDEAAARQAELFQHVCGKARTAGRLAGWTHIANSAWLFTAPGPHLDTVRPGISAYGVLPGDLPGADELRPVMSMHCQVALVKDLPRGAPVGYGSTWRASRRARIATLSVGYADGVPWALGNRGEVWVRGARAPMIGNVSMDYVTIDVTDVPGVAPGDRVTLFGSAGAPTVEEVARRASTIPYEVTCSVGRRVPRIVRGGEELLVPSTARTHSGAGMSRERGAIERAAPGELATRVGPAAILE